MKGDGLKTDQVVAGRDGRGDRCCPRRVVGDHLASTPGAVIDGAGEQTSLVDLEPLESVSIDTRTGRARALSQVGQLRKSGQFLRSISCVRMGLPLGRRGVARPGSNRP